MIVVDVNVIAYLLLSGDRSEAMDRLRKQESDWIAPRLWLDEFLNVLCTYERTGNISAETAVELLEDALALMADKSYEVPPERVLAVARRTGCTGCDSQYLTLAEDLGLKFYTCDKGILKKCPNIAVAPK